MADAWSTRRPGRFLARIRLDASTPEEGYPFTVPVVRALRAAGGLAFHPGVTLVVGENGSGKSTLVEAIAVAIGLNAEGGTRSFRFSTRASESDLGEHLVVTRDPGRERAAFFLRAESYYNVATEVERLGVDAAYGGTPHERSHGESFLALLSHRFRPRGLYLLDEPEAALSPTSCLAAMERISRLVDQGSQFIIATHSPLLLALPGARILQIDDTGHIRPVAYDDAGPVALTRAFLDDPQLFLHHLDVT